MRSKYNFCIYIIAPSALVQYLTSDKNFRVLSTGQLDTGNFSSNAHMHSVVACRTEGRIHAINALLLWPCFVFLALHQLFLPFAIGECVPTNISGVSGQKGPTRHADALHIRPFWQDTLDISSSHFFLSNRRLRNTSDLKNASVNN